MAVGRRRTPQATRSEGCGVRRALRPAVVILAALALLLAVSGCGGEEESPETSHIDLPCGPSRGFEALYKHFLYWTPDGAYLVFDVNDTIWTLNIEDTQLQEVADVSQNYDPGKSPRTSAPKYGFYADVSPDGSRIVYSTCEYPAG